MKPNQYITFYIDTWKKNKHVKKLFKAKIERITYDPLMRHESKCIVSVNNELYGIPFNEVIKIFPANNEQLKLKL